MCPGGLHGIRRSGWALAAQLSPVGQSSHLWGVGDGSWQTRYLSSPLRLHGWCAVTCAGWHHCILHLCNRCDYRWTSAWWTAQGLSAWRLADSTAGVWPAWSFGQGSRVYVSVHCFLCSHLYCSVLWHPMRNPRNDPRSHPNCGVQPQFSCTGGPYHQVAAQYALWPPLRMDQSLGRSWRPYFLQCALRRQGEGIAPVLLYLFWFALDMVQCHYRQ